MHCSDCQHFSSVGSWTEGQEDKVKHPKVSYAVQNIYHLPTKPDYLCTVGFYMPLPIGRFGFRYIYIYIYIDVFSKFVKLYSLKAATIKACLNNIPNNLMFLRPCIMN